MSVSKYRNFGTTLWRRWIGGLQMDKVPDCWVGREVIIIVFSPSSGRGGRYAYTGAPPAGILRLRGGLETSNVRGISGTWTAAGVPSSTLSDPDAAVARFFRFYSWGSVVYIEPVGEP